MPNDFTPTSGSGFNDDLSFSVGMECFFTEPYTPAEVAREYDVPVNLNSLTIFGGSVAMRPRDPENTSKYFKADGLFRVFLDGVMLLNVILKTSFDPANLAVAPFVYAALPGIVEPRKLRIVFDAAGARFPINMELQLCGVWS